MKQTDEVESKIPASVSLFLVLRTLSTGQDADPSYIPLPYDRIGAFDSFFHFYKYS